jgi:hypothetical protein
MIMGLLALGVMLGACKGSSKSASDQTLDGYVSNSGIEYGILNFAGLRAITEYTDTTVQLSWTAHPQALYYVVFQKELDPNPAANYQIKAILPPHQNSLLIKNLTPQTNYAFKIKAYDQQDRMDLNGVVQTVQLNQAPSRPVAVVLKNPALPLSFTAAPTITVRYVKPGETVRLYQDAACTQELGSGVVAAEKDTIDIQTAPLETLTPYTIYANSTNVFGHTSDCSTAYATYKRAACLDEDFAAVEGNAALGTEAFCVMRTEARNNGEDVPAVIYEELPWIHLPPSDAKTACQGLSGERASCDLLSNPQWMTMARDIEAYAPNWSAGAVGTGSLNRGHSDNSPNGVIAITDSEDPWDQTGNDASSWSQKRTHVLSTGDEVWDLAGNVNEWVDWTTGGDTFSCGPNTCLAGWQNIYAVDCADLNPEDYLPGNPAQIPQSTYTSGNYNIGLFFGTPVVTQERNQGGAAARGGTYGMGISSGIYALTLTYPTDYVGNENGFRCVCQYE